MKRTTTCFGILILTCIACFTTRAQGISPDSVKAQLIKDWERAKAYTMEYLNTMPADKYGTRPVDSIRSFSEQMLHLSSGNVGLSFNATARPRIFGGRNIEKAPGAQSKDSVVYFVTASYDYVINGIKDLDAAKLSENTGRFSRLVWLMKAFEHQTHHRGQCTIYIRLVGIRPPNERLF